MPGSAFGIQQTHFRCGFGRAEERDQLIEGPRLPVQLQSSQEFALVISQFHILFGHRIS